MIALGFTIGALIVGLVLYLPFFLWFRLRGPKASGLVAHDLEVSLRTAFAAARKLRCETVSLEQLLLALLDNPRAAEVLRACAVDIEAMRTSVSAMVRDSTPVASRTVPVEPAASPEFQRVLERAFARVAVRAQSKGQRPSVPKASSWKPANLRKPAGRPAANGADVLVALLEEPHGDAVEELWRHGVTRLKVTRFIAHGITGDDPALTPPLPDDSAAAMAIVLENDDFTPMEFVVDALQEHLGLTRESAVRVMLEVHHEGRAVAGCFPAGVAVDKAERLRAAAMQAGHPLRCVVEADMGV
jgi:ATP-dependent Clp protease adapter protein ClpS